MCPFVLLGCLSRLDHNIQLNLTLLKTGLISVKAVMLVPLCARNYSLIR